MVRTAIPPPASGRPAAATDWLGDSQMASEIARFDWARTPLGPVDGWPGALRSAVAICLHSHFRMAIWWGRDLTCIYNDPERIALATLHPAALGQPARTLLRDSWDLLGRRLESVMRTGVPTGSEDEELIPLIDGEGGIGGVLLVTHDTTARVRERVSSDQRLHALLADLRAAQRRAAAARDAERRRMERDLHDGAQQRLVAVQLALGGLAEQLESDPAAARDELEVVRSDLADALDELRELAHGVYPPLLATDGLVTALEATARRAALPTKLEAGDVGRLPSEIEAAAYFCCLEALQNAGKHAGDNACATVRVARTGDVLRFSVEDDGAGFDLDGLTEGAGLVNLRDRVMQLGGSADVSSAPGRGTCVSGEIPLD